MPLLLAETVFLVSWYKPILLVAIFALWAWVISAIYDKDAAQWYLKRRLWNGIHVTTGVLALALVLALPLSFLITGPALVVILGAELLAYFMIRNADEKVPAHAKWSLNPSKLFEGRAKKGAKDKIKKTTTLIFKGPKGIFLAPEKEAPEFEIRVAAESLINKLADVHGSQIDIGPVKDGVYGASFLVDGVRQAAEQYPAAKGLAVIDVFKGAAGLDVADRRRRQVGEFTVSHSAEGGTKIRATTLGTSAGVQLTLLLDPDNQVKRTLDELGLLPNQMEDVKALIAERSGVVLQVAPPDGGRTTTFYALMRSHDAYTTNVQTVEYDIQMSIEGARQNKFDPGADKAEYSTTVRSILRRDPEVVGVAEMPDENTGREVARSDHQRTRVYLSFHADGAMQAIQKYARAVGDQAAAAESLHGVIAQKLCRRLCTNCRVPFQPTPEMLKKVGLPPDTRQIHRKGGQVLVKDKAQTCSVCGGSGFFGQVSLFEVYTFGPEERKLIAANDLTGLRGLVRQRKQQSMQSAGLQKVLLGETSIEEVFRVTAAPDAAQQPPPSSTGVAPPAAKPAPAKPGAPAAKPAPKPSPPAARPGA